MTLNCQDYYFGAYTVGADIIMEDAYTIGINSSFSKWGTECNTTLGDCGCDNCQGGDHAILDVRDRMEDLKKYERWLGRWPKTMVHNPQSFHGEDYWSRDPTPEEEWAVNVMAINHGAKSIISWVYPASDELSVAHGQLARVVTTEPVVGILANADNRGVKVFVEGSDSIDVTYWIGAGDIILSVVNGAYKDFEKVVELEVPGATSIEKVLWGNATWTVDDGKVKADGIPALGTSLVLLNST